jgi:hypothetical protein
MLFNSHVSGLEALGWQRSYDIKSGIQKIVEEKRCRMNFDQRTR